MHAMIADFLFMLLPLFFLAAGGYLLTPLFKLSEDTLIRIVTDFFMPLLVFHSLYSSSFLLTNTLKFLGVVSTVLAILCTVSYVYCRIFHIDFRSFSLPVLFVNSGFLGIPLMKLWGGAMAMNAIVVYDQIQTLYIFSLGIAIVTGGFTWTGFKEMAKSPLLWAIVAGFSFRYSTVRIPDPLLNAFGFCGAAAPVLAIFALGCSLAKRRLTFDPHLASGILLRFVGGYFAGYLACLAFNVTGMERTVVLVASSLPSAVFSVVLTRRYGIDGRYAGSLILATSLAAVFVLPLLLALDSSVH